MNKKILVMAGVLFAAIVLFGCTQTQAEQNNNTGLFGQNANDSTNQKTYSLADVAAHNTEADCWVTLNSKVYNVTNLISKHPGGAGAIIPNCGKDATSVFETKGDKNMPHSDKAKTTLQTYFIGNLA